VAASRTENIGVTPQEPQEIASIFDRWFAVAAFALVVPALVAANSEAQTTSAGMCWRSLAPDTGEQDGPDIAESTLTSTRSGEVWISRSVGPNLLRWSNGRWTSPPALARAGVDELWVEAVAASPSGRILVAAAANRADGARVLHVARLNDGAWEWLGAPLVSTPEPFTHAQKPSIAFVGEQPVVAWSEERDANLAGLFVARWNGSSWTRLGVLTLDRDEDDSFLTPAVAVDVRQEIWLAWTGYSGGVRVARWNSGAWRDVERESLAQVVAVQGTTAMRELSLAIDSKGRAWVLRLAHQKPGPELALARWDVDGWTAIPPASGRPEKPARVWSASMILQGDAPLVAWSQADPTDNHHLHASTWAAGDRWTAQLSDLHLVEGVSNVMDVKLTAGDGRSFVVSWDEPGKDKRNTRMVQAYVCAPGEAPASPPASIVERDTWPTTVDEAARRLVALLDDKSKEVVRTTAKDQLIQLYSDWGRGIRNGFGLWRANDKLLESCGRGTKADPEDCSMVIIEAVWTLLQP
jgi:hypothetical protein